MRRGPGGREVGRQRLPGRVPPGRLAGSRTWRGAGDAGSEVGGCGRGLAGPDSRGAGVPGARGAGGASRAGPKPLGWPGCPDAGRLVH